MSDSMHVTPPVRRELSVTEEVRYKRGTGEGGGGQATDFLLGTKLEAGLI